MSKKLDAAEAVANSAIGLVVSWSVTFYALPLFGLYPTAGMSAGINATFFVVSTARSFAVRRVFRGLGDE